MWFLTIVIVLLCVCTAEGAYCCENSNVDGCQNCINRDDYDGVNMLILVPHGGGTSFTGLEERPGGGCYNSTTEKCTYSHSCPTEDADNCKVITITDSQTIALSKIIRNGVEKQLGRRPMRLYNRVSRSQLDPNREVDMATFGNSYAVQLYNLYHDNITYLINKTGGNACLVIDLHGMGEDNPNMTQIGVRLVKKDLLLNDSELQLLVNNSSIKHLSNYSGEQFVSFLRGDLSLARHMSDKGLLSIPSPDFPQMPTGKKYFGGSGSPILDIYSNLDGNPADVFQMEVHKDTRLNKTLREDFGDKLSEALAEFYRLHYDPSCNVNLCVNGECKANITDYTCQCDDGYSGRYCDEVTCSASPINNAIPFNASIAEGEDVIYACETGYSYSSGNLSRTCTVNGTLSGTDPTCSIVTCSASPTNNAQPDKTVITYGSSAVYTCDQGYIYSSGDLERTCEANGALLGTDPTCVNPPSQKCYTFSWWQIRKRDLYDLFTSTREANELVCLLEPLTWTTGCGSCKYDCCKDVNECNYKPCKDGCECEDHLGYFNCVRKKSRKRCRKGQFSIDITLQAVIIPATLPAASLIAFAYTQAPVIAILAALQTVDTTVGIISAWRGSLKITFGIETDIPSFDPKAVVQDTLEKNNFTDFKVEDAVKIKGVVCDVGYERDNTNQTCRECSPGSFSNTAFGFPCISCDPGNYQDEEGQTECKACPAGYFEKDNGSIKCKPCAVGHFSTEKSINCTKCDPGKYSFEGSAMCSLCNDGSVPNDNQSDCEQCSAGTFATSGDDECQQCDPGRYSTKGSGSCSLCNDGSVPNDDQSGCEQCSAGTFATSGDDECQQCDPGRFSIKGSGSCSLCNNGSVPNDDQSGCEQCSAGTFATSGDDECQQCDPGRYSTKGSASCSLCNDGSVPNDDQSGCEQCSAGTFATSGDDECQQCDPGRYSIKGSGSCSLCNNGSVPNDDQSGCEQCSAGTFATSGDDECQQCDPGRYSTKGSASCSLCNNGSVPNDDQSGCEECEAGSFAMSGNVSCQDCQVDKVSSAGAAYCEECPIGYMPSREQTNCTQNLAFNKTTDQKFSKGSSKSDEGSSNSDKRSSNSDNQDRDQELDKTGGNSKSGSRNSVKYRGKRSTSGRRDSGKGSSRKSKSGSSNKGKDSGDSDNAVDGIFYETCSHSSNDKKTWWNVDLEDPFNVTDVVIQSNTDCCEGELRDITVYVGNKKNDRKSRNVWGKYTGPAMPGERIYITRIKPIVGRYVTISRDSNNNKAYLTLCEVFVLGNKAPVSNPKKNSTKGSKSSHSD